MTTLEHLVAIDQHPESVYVLHEKSERRFPVHQHHKGQLSYIEGGIAYLHIRDRTYVIPARHYVWIPKGIDHFIHAARPSYGLRTIYFYSQGDEQHPFYSKLGIYPVGNLLLEMVVYTEQWNGNAVPGSVAFSFLSALKNILPQLKANALPIVLPTTANERLRPIILYLRAHIDEPLSIAQVSKQFNISERSLSRLFRSLLDISFLQYLKQLRMVQAIEMMLEHDVSLSQVAYGTGYASLAAFSNTFQQLTGMRPSDFVKSVR